MMLKDNLLDTLLHDLPEPLLRKVYFFHDLRVNCQTNHPGILAILDTMLRIFPEPVKIGGEITYFVLCYDSTGQFPVQLPARRIRTGTMRLLTNTKLKYYRNSDATTFYQSYIALPPINESVLSIINPAQGMALTQLERPEHYQARFLRRYVFLLALGQLMHAYGFEPCHAAAITAPWDTQQGALIIGVSGSGKTTLSIGCAIRGCGLLGDDLVMLREDTENATHGQNGTIGAYTISHEVSVRSGSINLWPTLSFLYDLPVDQRDKRYCTIEQLRPGATRTQTPIHLLLFPSLTTDTKSTITPLSKASTLQELLNECLDKKDLSSQAQQQLFALLCQLAEQAPGYRLAIAEGANDGPELICSLFNR